MTENKDYLINKFTIGSWTQKDISAIYEGLEQPNWAPWLSASTETLAGRAIVFPKGQLVIKSLNEEMLASLSMNRISWDADPSSLPSWDDVAGDPTTYINTYQPHGNTLTLMSMNVNPEHKGQSYARKLVDQAKLVALELGIEYIIGSFRPNEYGKYKLATKNNCDFETYCKMQRADSLPIDGWLRNLTRNGMKPVKVDHKAMIVSALLDKFRYYKETFKPESWFSTEDNTWECGEVGSWKIDYQKNIAIYQESNLWGILWEKPGLK